LITLISRLSDLQHLESALVIARKLKEEGLRAKIFVNLIPHLPSPLQDTVFKEALTTMQLQCDTQWQIEREKCVKENIRVQDSKELLIKTIINLADPISEPLKEKLFQEASNIAKIIEDVTARKIARGIDTNSKNARR
jgi:hypothetical protein